MARHGNRTGVEKTDRKVQPFNAWKGGHIVRFCYTELEAQDAVRNEG